MMTEQEQMNRFNAAVTELYSLQRKQIHRHTDKGGWDEMPRQDLSAQSTYQAMLAFNYVAIGDMEKARKHFADAANYLVLAFDRIREEGEA